MTDGLSYYGEAAVVTKKGVIRLTPLGEKKLKDAKRDFAPFSCVFNYDIEDAFSYSDDMPKEYEEILNKLEQALKQVLVLKIRWEGLPPNPHHSYELEGRKPLPYKLRLAPQSLEERVRSLLKEAEALRSRFFKEVASLRKRLKTFEKGGMEFRVLQVNDSTWVAKWNRKKQEFVILKNGELMYKDKEGRVILAKPVPPAIMRVLW